MSVSSARREEGNKYEGARALTCRPADGTTRVSAEPRVGPHSVCTRRRFAAFAAFAGIFLRTPNVTGGFGADKRVAVVAVGGEKSFAVVRVCVRWARRQRRRSPVSEKFFHTHTSRRKPKDSPRRQTAVRLPNFGAPCLFAFRRRRRRRRRRRISVHVIRDRDILVHLPSFSRRPHRHRRRHRLP